MTDTNTSSGKLPTHTAYRVREGRDGAKGHWVEIGAAWTNRDGSLSIQLDALPVDGRIVLQERREGDRAGQGASGSQQG